MSDNFTGGSCNSIEKGARQNIREESHAKKNTLAQKKPHHAAFITDKRYGCNTEKLLEGSYCKNRTKSFGLRSIMVSAPDCGSGDGSSILPEDITFWFNPKITSISRFSTPLWICDNFVSCNFFRDE